MKTTQQQRIEAMDLQWESMTGRDKPLWGMICADENNNYYIIGDAIECDESAHDDGCQCCAKSYGTGKDDIIFTRFAWLIPV